MTMKRMGHDPFEQAEPPYRIEIQPLAPRLSDSQLGTIVEQIVERLADALVPVKGLTPDEACAMIGCSHPFLITLEREGLLRPFRHGSNFTRYDQRQIARLLSTGRGVEQDAA